MVEPERVAPGALGKELEEPVGRLVSVSMLLPALPVPLVPLVPLVPSMLPELLEPLEPLAPLVSELSELIPLDDDGLLLELSLPLDPYPLVPEPPEDPDMPEELPDAGLEPLSMLLPEPLLPELFIPELPEEEPVSEEVPDFMLPLLASLPAAGRVVVPLWANATLAAPIMDTRIASRSFFMISPCKKLSLQQALKVSR